jgi:hypothetical protein
VISLQAFFFAASVVALLQFLRVRDKRLLPLVAAIALLAVAHHQGDWFAARPWHIAAGLALLLAIATLSPRSPVR